MGVELILAPFMQQAETYGLAGCRPGRSLGLPCSEPPGELLITTHTWQAVQSGQRLRALISWGRPAGEVLCCQPACRGAPRTRSNWRSCRDSGSDRIRVLRAVQTV